MEYYHPGQPKLKDSWENVQSAVTSYLDCAGDWYSKYPPTKPAPKDEDIKQACKPKYDSLTNNLNDLTSNLESARRYAWAGWESPQEIKALIQGTKLASPP
jgi:hypothetical protein